MLATDNPGANQQPGGRDDTCGTAHFPTIPERPDYRTVDAGATHRGPVGAQSGAKIQSVGLQRGGYPPAHGTGGQKRCGHGTGPACEDIALAQACPGCAFRRTRHGRDSRSTPPYTTPSPTSSNKTAGTAWTLIRFATRVTCPTCWACGSWAGTLQPWYVGICRASGVPSCWNTWACLTSPLPKVPWTSWSLLLLPRSGDWSWRGDPGM